MVPYIKDEDRSTAAFLVAIAKKESAWGKHSPKLDGKDCNNYWGFKSVDGQKSSGEYACFDSPKAAIETVGKRIDSLVKKQGLDSPQKMVVAWKCGFDCSWDNPNDVKKWSSDVGMYFDDIMDTKIN